MKKIIPALLALMSLIIGIVLGYVRGDVFHRYFDAHTGVILGDAGSSLGIMTAFLAVFALVSFVICRAFCRKSRLSRRFPVLTKIQIILGVLVILYSAFSGFTMADGGNFEKYFGVAALLGSVYFILALSGRRSTMTALLSCAAILPAVLMLLGIYKTNIKYPNISLFSFEVLAALFIMLGFYFLSAANFKTVRGHMSLWMTSLSLLFSAASVVSHYAVVSLYVFEPVLNPHSILYFISANVVLTGFSLRLEAEKEEKLVYNGEKGLVFISGDNSIAIDCEGGAFASVRREGATLTEEDTRYVAQDFAVCGFMYDGEGEAVCGQHITTPDGKTLLNLLYATPENLGSKLVKSLAGDYEKVDYVLLPDSDRAEELSGIVKEITKTKNVIKLSEKTEIVL